MASGISFGEHESTCVSKTIVREPSSVPVIVGVFCAAETAIMAMAHRKGKNRFMGISLRPCLKLMLFRVASVELKPRRPSIHSRFRNYLPSVHTMLKAQPIPIRITQAQLPHAVGTHNRLLRRNALGAQIFVSLIQVVAIKIENRVFVPRLPRQIHCRWPVCSLVDRVQHQRRTAPLQQRPIKVLSRLRLHDDLKANHVAVECHRRRHVEYADERRHSRKFDCHRTSLRGFSQAALGKTSLKGAASAAEIPANASSPEGRTYRITIICCWKISRGKIQADPLCRVTGRE